jgi:hypothetical protein
MKAILVGASLVAVVAFAGSAHAQTEDPGSDPAASDQPNAAEVSLSYVPADTPPEKQKIWHFKLAPYVIFPFMNGSMTLANQTVDVDLNTGDILKRLDWFLTLYFEARHPKFAIITDLLYMNLGQGVEPLVSGRSADFKMQQLAAELVVLGRIVKWFELGGGGRVNFVQAGLTAPGGMVLPAIDLDLRKTWFDPVVALRFLVPFEDDHWRLALRADVGGFTLGSTYSWQVYPYGGYNFDGIKGRRIFELGAAFRAFGMKYETGSGSNRFVYDMIIWGPELGFVFNL